MNDKIIHTYEHCKEKATQAELLELATSELPRLIENIDFRQGTFSTGYFIGLDRIFSNNRILYVAPKYDSESIQTNYLEMLSSCLRHPEVLGHTDELFFIDFEKKPIKTKHANDLITPLIIVQFLRVLKKIVKKGLQKGFYPVTDNLRSKIKGKILVTRTINRNHLKNDRLHTWCTYQEYGLNNPQNRLLNRAMQFIRRYAQIVSEESLNISNILSFIDPALERVGKQIENHEITNFKINPFFSEYGEAITLAKLILRRFGFNINAIRNEGVIEVPPFWIDMSKLFELYVLGKLKEALSPGEVIYQARGEYGELDFFKKYNRRRNNY